AGEALQDGHGFNLDHHRWVRLRLMLRQLEQQMIDLRRTIRDNPGPADIDRLSPYLASMHEFLECSGITHNEVQALIDGQLHVYDDEQQRFPLPADVPWLKEVLPRLYPLLLLIEVWGGNRDALFQLECPQDATTVDDNHDHIRLRVTPEL